MESFLATIGFDPFYRRSCPIYIPEGDRGTNLRDRDTSRLRRESTPDVADIALLWRRKQAPRQGLTLC